jgi:hypothetical protein
MRIQADSILSPLFNPARPRRITKNSHRQGASKSDAFPAGDLSRMSGLIIGLSGARPAADLRDKTLPLRRCAVGLFGCRFVRSVDFDGVMPPPFDRSDDFGTASGAAIPDLAVAALRT